MSNDQPHFLARRIQNAQRQAARSLLCSCCKEGPTFTSEPRLKEHATLIHPEVLPNLPESTEWKSYLEASRIRPKDVVKTVPIPSYGLKAPSDNDSMHPNPGDDSRSQSTRSRPTSTPGVQGVPGYTESFDKLSLAQRQTPTSPSGTHLAPSINPLKRSSRDSGEVGNPGEREERSSPRTRRTKAHSGGTLLGKGPDYERKNVGPKRLFNPQLDDPTRVASQAGTLGTGGAASLARPAATAAKHQPHREVDDSPRLSKKLVQIQPNPGEHSLHSKHGPEATGHLDIKDDVPEDHDDDVWMDPDPELLLQPETRPISHEQLVVEVKGIYAGLVMVEAKCIDVDDKQTAAAQERDPAKRTKLTSEQWSALIALHKTLLHEHHDFFLASQHPAASPALSKLAAKYSMPARMWRHGIHAFLEVLRHRLPESLDHMLAFIYIAYSMMALLYETVSSFEDTWIECLGDLGRYRMAIEDDDVRDREVWSGVARFWYAKAADKSPKVGRLYHHLAILARPYTIQQLSLYARSLTCIIPFDSARGSVMTLFIPILEGREVVYQRSNTMEVLYIKAHAILMTGKSAEEFRTCTKQLLDDGIFDKYIARANSKFREVGVWAALTNFAALLEYGVTTPEGTSRSELRLLLEDAKAQREALLSSDDTVQEIPAHAVDSLSPQHQAESQVARDHASVITFGVFAVGLRRRNDKHTHAMIHTYAVFIWYLSSIERAMELIEREIPWSDIVTFLNTIAKPETMTEQVRQQSFPKPTGPNWRPLPEDFVMRGQLHTETYFPTNPTNCFEDTGVDDEERILELPSFQAPRIERILWAFFQVAAHKRWISFDEKSCTFAETSYVKELPLRPVRGSLQPIETLQSSDSLMSGMEQPESTYQIPTNPSERVITTEPTRQSAPQPDIAKPSSRAPNPVKILKRGSWLEPKEDTQMEDSKVIKRESPSSPPEPRNPVTEEWLQQKHVKLDPDPEKHGSFSILDETKDPTAT